MAITIEKSRLLIVEGKDEENFFGALLKVMPLSTIQILPMGGKTLFPTHLTAIVETAGFANVERIGVVRDSDGNPDGAFVSVCSALEASGLVVPSQAQVFAAGKPGTGILILPPSSAGTNRMLEDICMVSVEAEAAIECLDDYFVCLAGKGIVHRDAALAKARLHAFLASRVEPDLRLGEAARKGYWNWNHSVFDPVKAFLQQLAQP
jgi:hypothetical protein